MYESKTEEQEQSIVLVPKTLASAGSQVYMLYRIYSGNLLFSLHYTLYHLLSFIPMSMHFFHLSPSSLPHS